MKNIIGLEEDTEAMVSKDVLDAEVKGSELKEEFDDIKDIDDDVNTASDDVETLDKIKSILEQSPDKDGISEDTAKIAQVSIEAIYKRLGVKSKPLPALEAFGSKHSKAVATKLAIESISETIKSVWLAIKNAILKMYEKVKEFFKNYFSYTRTLKNTAKELKDKASKVKGLPKEQNLDIPIVVKNFYNSKTHKVEVDTVLANHMVLNNNFLNTTDTITSSLHAFEKQIHNPSIIQNDIGIQLKNLSSKILHGFKDYDYKRESLIYGYDVKEIGPFVGGTYMFVKGNTGLNASMNGFLSIELSRMEPPKQQISLKALDSDECKDLANAVYMLLEATEKFQDKKSKLDSIFKEFIKLIDGIITVTSKMYKQENNVNFNAPRNEDTHNDIIETLRKGISDIRRVINFLILIVPNMNVRAANSALSYVKASLNNIEEPDGDLNTYKSDTKLLTA